MSLFSIGHADVVLGGTRVLHDVTASDGGAGFVCVIGPNGAGKSTLLRLMNGLVVPTTGTVETLGQAVTPRTALRVRRRVGYVAQTQGIDSRQPMTVAESVLSGTYGRLGLFRRPGAAELAAASEALEAVGLGALAGRPVGALSGGESQKMAIARALAQEPGLLLLDEPTASLDWQAQRDVVHLIARLHRERRIPVVMVTHDLNLVGTDVCDRVVCVRAGGIHWVGPSREAMDADLLSGLFGVPVSIVEHRHRHVALA